ncbi:tetratricopeptide repeat protein [Elusimicrobiota bacterium]
MKRILILIFVSITLHNPVFALVAEKLNFENHEVTKLEKDFFDDLDDGKLDKYTLIDAFVIASGITNVSDFNLYKAQLQEIKNNAVNKIVFNKDPYITAKRILFWLHDNVFGEYSFGSSYADDIVNEKKFNCVSASIMYVIIAKDLGLDVVGVIVKDHAFCMLKDRRGNKDIETTIRYGFDPGTKEIEKLKEVTKYVYVPPKNYKKRRNVNEYQLIGVLYSNSIQKIGENLKESKEDLAKYKKGYYFDPKSKLFETDVIACFNNLAIQQMDKGDFNSAYGFIRQGKKFLTNSKNFNKLEAQYFNKKAEHAASKENYPEALGFIRIGLSLNPKDKVLKNNLGFYFSEWAGTFFRNKEYSKAIDIYWAGLKELPKDEVLLKNLRTSYYNMAIEEYNAQHFKNVIDIVDQALESFPNDEELLEIQQASRDMME